MGPLRVSFVLLSVSFLVFHARNFVLQTDASTQLDYGTDSDLTLKAVNKIDEPQYQPREQESPEPEPPKPRQSDPAPVPRPPVTSSEAVSSSSFDYQWYTFTECKKPYLTLKKSTTDVRLHVLDVLNSGLQVLGRRPAQEGDDRTLTYICALAVGFTDAYRAMRQASKAATGDADETGVSVPLGKWFSITLKKEAEQGKKTKRAKTFYTKCAFIADRVDTILAASDYHMPGGATVAPPTALATHMNGSFDEHSDISDKQISYIIGHCLREKDDFKGKSWGVIHHALIQVWTGLHYMAQCAIRMLPLSHREKLALLVAQQTMLNHRQTPTFYSFLGKFQQFAFFGQKSGYFPSAKDMRRSVACGPTALSSEDWAPANPSVSTAFLMDFSTILQ
nr:TPA: hypothetical protein BN1204_037470 [Neospora caninum Liverpool]